MVPDKGLRNKHSIQSIEDP